VKDHRTGHEVGDADRVLDGDLDGFIRAALMQARESGLAKGVGRR
jgi:peptide chain release factor 2